MTDLETAAAYLQQGNIPQAVTHLKNAVIIEADNPVPHFLLFQVLQAMGQGQESLPYLQRAIQLKPEIASILHIQNAENCIRQGHPAEAQESVWQALKVTPNDADSFVRGADLLFEIGNIPDALRCFEFSMKIDPSRAVLDNTKHIYNSLPYRLGNTKMHLHELRLDLAKTPYPEALCGTPAGRVYSNAVDAARNGRLDLAKPLLEECIGMMPEFAEAYMQLGNLHLMWRFVHSYEAHNRSACAAFFKAVTLRPDWVEAQYKMGRALGSFGRNPPAEYPPPAHFFERAIQLDSNHEDTYLDYADYLWATEGKPKAFELYTEYQRCYEARIEQHPLSKLGIGFVSPLYSTNIGHSTTFPRVHVKSQEYGWLARKKWIWLSPTWGTANPYLVQCWKEHFTIITDDATFQTLYPLCRELAQRAPFFRHPDGYATYARCVSPQLDRMWDEEKRPHLLRLPQEDVQKGWDTLHELGLPKGQWFVAIHARDAGYKNESLAHPYIDGRCCDIRSMIPAIEAIVEAGGWVVRLGEPSSPKLPPLKNVIDYGHSRFKSYSMDIFIASQCRMFICNFGGILGTPQAFGVPCIVVNGPTHILQDRAEDLFIPKMLWSTPLNRYVTFKEWGQFPFVQEDVIDTFTSRGISLRENAPEDIKEITIEMLERLDGKLVYSEEDQKLQERFRGLQHKSFGEMTSRMGRRFLAKYAHLLE